MVNGTEALSVRQMVRDLNCEVGAVAVEGKRDAAALRGLGFAGMLMQFHRHGGFTKFADAAVLHPRVILLFDYDRKGRYMIRRLMPLLQRRTIPDLTYRRRLRAITRGRVRFVEELLQYQDHTYDGIPSNPICAPLRPHSLYLEGLDNPLHGHGHGGPPHVDALRL